MITTEQKDEMKFICKRVEIYFKLSPYSLHKRTRLKEIAFPRQIAMYLMRLKGINHTTIGRFFEMNHATVIHAENKIWGERQIYEDVEKIVMYLMNDSWRKTNKYYEKGNLINCLPCIVNNFVLVYNEK